MRDDNTDDQIADEKMKEDGKDTTPLHSSSNTRIRNQRGLIRALVNLTLIGSSVAFLLIPLAFQLDVVVGGIQRILTQIYVVISDSSFPPTQGQLVLTLLFTLAATIALPIILSRSKFVKLILSNLVRSERSFYFPSSSLTVNDSMFSRRDPNFFDDDAWTRYIQAIYRTRGLDKGDAADHEKFQRFLDSNSKDIVQEAVVKVSKEVEERLRKNSATGHLLDLEKRSLSRLSDQVVVLGGRARISQIAGLIFCFAGLGVLWLTLDQPPKLDIQADTGSTTLLNLLMAYAPRLSLVLIIEFIGFFFLKLFRSTLDEIRVTQNEITNVEMKLIATHRAALECPDVLSDAIKELSITERNAIIQKGQTTVELERARGQQEADARFTRNLLGILKGKGKA